MDGTGSRGIIISAGDFPVYFAVIPSLPFVISGELPPSANLPRDYIRPNSFCPPTSSSRTWRQNQANAPLSFFFFDNPYAPIAAEVCGAGSLIAYGSCARGRFLQQENRRAF